MSPVISELLEDFEHAALDTTLPPLGPLSTDAPLLCGRLSLAYASHLLPPHIGSDSLVKAHSYYYIASRLSKSAARSCRAGHSCIGVRRNLEPSWTS